MLSIILPKSERHPQIRLTFRHPTQGDTFASYDDGFTEVSVPEHLSGDEIEIVAHHCDVNGVPDPQMVGILLKASVIHETPKEPVVPPDADDAPDGEVSDAGADALGNDEGSDADAADAHVEQEEPASEEMSEAALLAEMEAEEAAKE